MGMKKTDLNPRQCFRGGRRQPHEASPSRRAVEGCSARCAQKATLLGLLATGTLILMMFPSVAGFPQAQSLRQRTKRGSIQPFTFGQRQHAWIVTSSSASDGPETPQTPALLEEETEEYDDGVSVFIPSDPNDHRYSASDWLVILRSIPRSTILKAIRQPCLVIVGWSTVISAAYKIALSQGWTAWANSLAFSSKPHSFLVSALGLLLVFRTNSAYQKFNEGRQIWERIHSESRNLSRLAILYQKELGDVRLHRMLRLLAAYPYLLHQHIQPHHDPTMEKLPHGLALPDRRGFGAAPKTAVLRVSRRFGRHNSNNKKDNNLASSSSTTILPTGNQNHWVDRRELPWCLFPPKALNRCVHSSNRPLWVCDCLSQEATRVKYTDNFTSRERLQFLSQIGRLSQAIGQCERIHQTAVPLNYARHSLRSLTLWLFTLPFALVKDFGMLTGPVMGMAAWLLYGIYQIGYTIEDPFQGSLRLSILCDAIYRDVMYDTDQMERRLSAFRPTTAKEDLEWSQLDSSAATNGVSLVNRPMP